MNKLVKYNFVKVESIEQVGNYENEYVYDVEVDDDTHTFISNDILVHNSLFVSFKPAIDHCEWKNNFINQEYLDNIDVPFVIINGNNVKIKTTNKNLLGSSDRMGDSNIDFFNLLKLNPEIIIIDGKWINNRDILEVTDKLNVKWNWSKELDFIVGFDKLRYAGYFKENLEDYASTFNVDNRQDFELEKINDSIINIAKKKYIQNITYEDGILHDNLSYIFPKGVELVRSSTPAFARDKIVNIVKYLFSNPETFNIRELLKMVKSLKSEFDLCYPDKIDDIAMQSSCSNYELKVLDDKEKLTFVDGAHFGVKAAALHNHLLYKNKQYSDKYEYLKSGSKIKYYYCNSNLGDIFAYSRGSFPVEFAPSIDLDTQFMKCILSPINSIIKVLNLPEITKRLSVVMSIFGDL